MEPQLKKSGKMQKAFIIIIILAVVLAVIIFWQKESVAPGPAGENLSPADNSQTQTVQQEDTTSAINQDLEGINFDDLDQEFKDIDADLNNL